MSLSIPVQPSPEQESDYPALGFVPAPGDEPTAARIAEDVRQTATTLGDIVYLLRGTAGPGQWRGRSADAFREDFDGDFRPKVEAAQSSFAIAATALEDWAAYMPGAQRRARNLEIEAREAQTALEALPTPTPVNLWDDDLPDDERDEALAEFSRQQGDVDAAQQRLEDIRSRARDLHVEYTGYGEAIADRLGTAMDIAPNKPGWLSRIGDAIGAIIDEVADLALAVLEDIGRWIREHAAKLALVGDILWAIGEWYHKAGTFLTRIAPIVPIPQLRGAITGAGRALKGAGTVTRLEALALYGIADWGGADVEYPWEEIEWPWESPPWEDDMVTRPIELDQFLGQGGPIEPAAEGAEALTFVPGSSARTVLHEAVAETAEDDYLAMLSPPDPQPVAIPDVPLFRSFDAAWSTERAA